MENSTDQIILSGRLSAASADQVRVYLTLLADARTAKGGTAKFAREQGKVVSNLKVQSCASLANLTETTTQRVLEELVRKKWIAKHDDTLYCLGDFEDFEFKLYLPEVSKPEPEGRHPVVSEILKRTQRKREEDAEKTLLTAKAKRRLAREVGLFPSDPEKGGDRTAGSKWLSFYKEEFESRFSITAPLAPGPDAGEVRKRSAAYAKRFVMWCGNDLPAAKGFLTWIFDNWDLIKAALGDPTIGYPDLCFICTKRVVDMLMTWEDKGIPEPGSRKRDVDGVAHRAKYEDDHIDEGDVEVKF